MMMLFDCHVQEREELVRSAYVKAEALVKRCLGNSHKVWNQMARWSQMSAPPPERLRHGQVPPAPQRLHVRRPPRRSVSTLPASTYY